MLENKFPTAILCTTSLFQLSICTDVGFQNPATQDITVRVKQHKFSHHKEVLRRFFKPK